LIDRQRRRERRASDGPRHTVRPPGGRSALDRIRGRRLMRGIDHAGRPRELRDRLGHGRGREREQQGERQQRPHGQLVPFTRSKQSELNGVCTCTIWTARLPTPTPTATDDFAASEVVDASAVAPMVSFTVYCPDPTLSARKLKLWADIVLRSKSTV